MINRVFSSGSLSLRITHIPNTTSAVFRLQQFVRSLHLRYLLSTNRRPTTGNRTMAEDRADRYAEHGIISECCLSELHPAITATICDAGFHILTAGIGQTTETGQTAGAGQTAGTGQTTETGQTAGAGHLKGLFRLQALARLQRRVRLQGLVRL